MTQHEVLPPRTERRRSSRRAAAAGLLVAGALIAPFVAPSAVAAADSHDTPPIASPPFDGARCEAAAFGPDQICWSLPSMTKMLRLHLHNPGSMPVRVHTNGAYGDIWVEINESKTFILAPGDHVFLVSQRWPQTIDVLRVED